MPRRVNALQRVCLLTLVAGALAVPLPAGAQEGFVPVGARAEGMGGAFVAVADDASAVYWNPAGLPGIPLFDAVLDRTDSDRDPSGTGGGAAGRNRAVMAAVALPVVALSYVSLDTASLGHVATAAAGPNRQDPGTAAVGHALRTHQVGLTLVQSLTDYVVVGGTVRLVRADAVVGPVAAVSDAALDALWSADGRSSTHVAADFGLMTYLGRLRVGLSVRDATAPSYEATDGLAIDVDPSVRVGAAWGPEPGRGRRRWTVAADAALTTTERPDGRWRTLAVGAERWWRENRLALRGGLRAQSVGDARPVATGGGSLVIWSALVAEAQVTLGDEAAGRGWSVGARVTF
jgi:hypothetical protein